MRKFMVAGAAVATALLLSVSISTMALASPAASGAVLTWGHANGINVGKNQILKANLAPKAKGIFVSDPTSGGTITCTKSSFTAKVTNNPKKPGTATESLTAQTFSDCKATGNPDITGVKSVLIDHLPYKTTISDKKGDPVTVSDSETTLNLDSTVGLITCVYKATTTTGSASNKTQAITFTSQTFKKLSGPEVCTNSGKFSASYGPVIDTNVKGDPHVFVN
jgi:hypothetical protein